MTPTAPAGAPPPKGGGRAVSARGQVSRRGRRCERIDKTGREGEPSLSCAKVVRLWQVECSHQEHRHLGAGDRVLRTVVATATAGGDALRSKLLDPGSSPITGRYVIETGA